MTVANMLTDYDMATTEKLVLDTNAGKQLPQAATYILLTLSLRKLSKFKYRFYL
jgi:hypothetical protein